MLSLNLCSDDTGAAFQGGRNMFAGVAVHAEAIVGDFENDFLFVGLEVSCNFTRTGVFENVGEAFLVKEANVDAASGREFFELVFAFEGDLVFEVGEKAGG